MYNVKFTMYNEYMVKAVPDAFTLIELLVAIAIMAVISAVAFSNFKSFGEDQNLKNAVLDVQSLLRAAQTNATTNLKCNNNPVTAWKVSFINSSGTKLIRTFCEYQGSSGEISPKDYNFKPNIELEKVHKGNDDTYCVNDISGSNSVVVAFAPLSGSVSFISYDNPPNACLNDAGDIAVVLKNTKTKSESKVIMDKGGSIYAQ